MTDHKGHGSFAVTLTLAVYTLCFPFLFALYFPVYLLHLIRRGGFIDGFGERFSLYSADKKRRLAALETPVWIHAVSVGEVVAALDFIRAWRLRRPGLQVVISTTTSTGQALARERAPNDVVVIYSPFDFLPFSARVLNRVDPAMLVIFEVEVWPGLITTASRRGIKLALINCRMSDSSSAGYLRYRWLFGSIFDRFHVICAQSDQDAERIQAVTGEGREVVVCNTMKFDKVPDVQDDGTMAALIDAVFPQSDRIIFTAASTHPGEEAVVADAVSALLKAHRELCLILVPRHAERATEAEGELNRVGIGSLRLTTLRDGGGGDRGTRAVVVDTTGDLMAVLALSDIVFVGKTLAGNTGGHNIIEPAVFGRAIIFGPHMENFRRVSQIFKDAAAAIELKSESDLEKVLKKLLEDGTERERLGKAARQTVERHRGATGVTIARLDSLLPEN